MAQDLEKFAHSVSQAGNLEQVTRPLLELLERVTHLESTYLTTIDQEAGVQQILYARNIGQLNIPEGLQVPWSDTLCKRALDEKRFITQDVPASWGDSEAARALGLQTYLSTPVYTDDGELYGTLCGASSQSVEVDPTVAELLDLFSRLISHQASREKMASQARVRANAAEIRASEMQLVAEIGSLCLSSSDIETLLESITISFSARPFWVSGVAFCADASADSAKDAAPDIRTLASSQKEFQPLISALVKLARHRAAYRPKFLRLSDAEPEIQQYAADVGIAPNSLLFLMTAASGENLQGGVLLTGQEDDISESERTTVKSCWQILTLYAERNHQNHLLQAANTLLTMHARHDPLTELPNRRFLVQEMQRMLAHVARSGEIIYIAFIDLDGFKKINDTYGHDVGDDFLCAMAECLRSVARKGDLPARYGGDEFVLIAANHEDQSENACQAITERLGKALSGRIQLPSLSLDYQGPSIGVIAWQGTDIPDADKLLAQADKAMYEVKMRRRAAR